MTLAPGRYARDESKRVYGVTSELGGYSIAIHV